MADESGSNLSPEKEQLSSSPSRSTPGPSAQQRFNLLLAEDNLPDVLLVREAIKMAKLPLDVYVVPDGQEAIEFIEKAEHQDTAPCPHFMLLDLNLPKRDGFEVLKRLRASDKCQSVPVLIITSSDSPSDKKQAASYGAAYFRKPASYEEFLKVGEVLGQLLKEKGLL